MLPRGPPRCCLSVLTRVRAKVTLYYADNSTGNIPQTAADTRVARKEPADGLGEQQALHGPTDDRDPSTRLTDFAPSPFVSFLRLLSRCDIIGLTHRWWEERDGRYPDGASVKGAAAGKRRRALIHLDGGDAPLP